MASAEASADIVCVPCIILSNLQPDCFPFSHRLVAAQIWVHVHVKEDDDDGVNDDDDFLLTE